VLSKIQITEDKITESVCIPEFMDGRTSVVDLLAASAELSGMLGKRNSTVLSLYCGM
jgi:hypothetical protein